MSSQIENKAINYSAKVLIDAGKSTVCTFIVGTDRNRQFIMAQKIFLAKCSPVFGRMFFENIAETSDRIVIRDVKPDIFKALIDYILSNLISITSFEKACELYSAAKRYQVPKLLDHCMNYLLFNLNVQTACKGLEFALAFNKPTLRELSMRFISKYMYKILEDCSYVDIDFATFIIILEQNVLNIQSELDLFDALINYIERRGIYSQRYGLIARNEFANVDVEQLPTSQHDRINKNRKNLLMLPQALGKIRFLTMTMEQFDAKPARSKLLTEIEMYVIRDNIASPFQNVLPMPKGFTDCRIPRYVRNL